MKEGVEGGWWWMGDVNNNGCILLEEILDQGWLVAVQDSVSQSLPGRCLIVWNGSQCQTQIYACVL